jgi:zinc transport system substrate-binding protein
MIIIIKLLYGTDCKWEVFWMSYFNIKSTRRVHRASVAFISAIALSLGSCASDAPTATTPQTTAPASSVAQKREIEVITTFLPVTQFTKAVAGDRAEVIQLLPTSVSPHDFQARPEDIQKLSKADVLVQNGLEMEEFLEDLVQNTGNNQLRVIDSSKGVKTISSEAIESHSHEGEKKGAEKHEHGAMNPHIWLDPKRAVKQVENIRDGLIAADPEGISDYTANAAAYIQQLRDLDAEIAKQLQPFSGKSFVAFHDFAPYFADSYKLKANFLVDVPEENPSPQDVKRVTDEVNKSNLKAILTEPQAGESAFGTLAKDLNVKIGTFDPIETGGTEATEPSYYISTMRRNVQNLVTAFGGSTRSAELWQPQPLVFVP